MSGLIGDLLSTAQALAAQQKGIEVAGRNLANVNNPNYARQRVDLGTLGMQDTPTGPESMGTQVLSVQQVRDQLFDTQVTREISQTSYLDAQQGQLQKAQSSLGENITSSSNASSITDTGSPTNGISASLNDFFNSFSAVAASPTDTGAKQVLLAKADVLASKLNVADGRLATLQGDITTQMTTDVQSVNNLLQSVASLNVQIARFEVEKPNSAVDLRDQRQADLEQLAKYMDFSTQPSAAGNGQIEIIAHDSAGASVVLLDKSNVYGALSLSGSQFTFGANTLGLQGGSLQGNLVTRDTAVQGLRDQLNTTAQQLTASVNKAYNSTGTTGNFFQAGPLAGGIIALDSTLNMSTFKTTDTGDAGGNELALAVADVGNKTHSTAGGDLVNGTIAGFYTNLVTGLGGNISGIESKLGDQQTIENMVLTQRNSISGVSLDEEMTNLMQFQRAYQASARIVNVLDDLLDTVVNRMGA